MSEDRIVWSAYKPFYENAQASSKPYNPVELMGYLSFSSPSWIIRGIGAAISDDNLTGLVVWTAEIQPDGTLGDDKGPMFLAGNTEPEAEIRLAAGWVAVAWGMKASSGDVSNIVLWARKWNPKTKRLEGDAVAHGSNGSADVEMSTPVSSDTQQIIIGIGAGVKSNNVNRIAAGYATLGMKTVDAISPVIWGSVNDNGTPKDGRNFSSEKLSTGKYRLTWKNNPAVVPTVGLSSGTRSDEKDGSDNVFSFSEVTSTGCIVYSVDVGQSKQKLQDEAFSFVAFFPGERIPGLVFGTVAENGIRTNGSTGWSAIRESEGKYKISFNPLMDPRPNLIMTSGTGSTDSNGSDNVISNTVPTTEESYVYSLDVGDGSPRRQDKAFSFFAWNDNVLPMDPLLNNLKIVAKHSLAPGKAMKVTEARVAKKSEKTESVFYVSDQKGDGHWEIKFNFPLPETPIIYASAVKDDSGESDGAPRIISYQNVTDEGYELWCIRVGNGKTKAVDGALEATVAMPDQFPL